MKNYKTWLIYCVSFIGCFCAMIAIDLACGGEVDPYDYYTSFFHSNIKGGKEYKPFYFTNYLFLYDETEPESEEDINAGEWATYLGAKHADVSKAMYHLDKPADSVLLAGHLKTGTKLPDSLAGNTFLKALIGNAGALKYYRFAKSVEKIANTTYERWEPKPMDTVALRDAGELAFKNAETEKDSFIKLRYYYQAQRLLHYAHAYNQAKAVYDKFLAPISTQSHVKGWAMALKAGEERRLGDTVKAAYLFSKVFAQYPERRLQAYRNYRYMNVKTDAVISLAATKTERAVIYAIDGFGNPQFTMEPLKKVYEYEPTSPMVAVLLVREVNKLEEQYLTPKLQNSRFYSTGYTQNTPDSINARSIMHLQQLKGFCKQLAADKSYPDANLAQLAAAYLCWMHNDTDEGSELLKSFYNVTLDDKLNDQKQIIQLLLTSQKIELLNQVNEATLLPSLKWLESKVNEEQQAVKHHNYDFVPMPFTATSRNFYQQILAPAYLKQCDTTMTALALSKSGDMMGFWQSGLHSSHVRTLIRYRLMPPVNPYLNFLTESLATQSTSDLYELLGTAYLREHNYPSAMAALKHVNAATLNNTDNHTPADPFIELINDYPKMYRYGQSKGLNKLQFAIAMNTLEQNIIKDPANTASYYYKLGAGLYNTSTYGNAWYLISYSWSAYDFGREKLNDYDDDYIKTTNAEKYFLKAAQLSKTQEFRARCIFMAAKCRQKQFTRPSWILPDFDSLDKAYMDQIKSSPYFEDLKKHYSKTAFYKKAVTECSYLKDYIRTK
jgi:hypothetical protein